MNINRDNSVKSNNPVNSNNPGTPPDKSSNILNKLINIINKDSYTRQHYYESPSTTREAPSKDSYTSQHYYDKPSTTFDFKSQEAPIEINKKSLSFRTLAEIANEVIGEFNTNTTKIIEKDAKTVLTYLKNEKLITNFMKDAPNFSIQQHTWHLDKSFNAKPSSEDFQQSVSNIIQFINGINLEQNTPNNPPS